MRRWGLTFLCFFMVYAPILAQEADFLGQSGGMDPSMFLDSEFDSPKKQLSKDKKIEKFQTFFIQETFTRPMFEMQDTMLGDDDDNDEDEYVSSKQDNEMMNTILSYVLAQDLAKRDAFRLKKTLLSRSDELDI